MPLSSATVSIIAALILSVCFLLLCWFRRAALAALPRVWTKSTGLALMVFWGSFLLLHFVPNQSKPPLLQAMAAVAALVGITGACALAYFPDGEGWAGMISMGAPWRLMHGAGVLCGMGMIWWGMAGNSLDRYWAGTSLGLLLGLGSYPVVLYFASRHHPST